MSTEETLLQSRLSREVARFEQALTKALADMAIPDEQIGSLAAAVAPFEVGRDGEAIARVEAMVYHPGQWPAMRELDRKRIPSATVAALLSAVREALALPIPGPTPEDEKEARRLADARQVNVVAILTAALDEPVDEDALTWATGAVRRSVEQNPVTYTAFAPKRPQG